MPKPVEPPAKPVLVKHEVAVPRFGGERDEGSASASSSATSPSSNNYRPMKRPAADILEELGQMQLETLEAAKHVPPRGPLLDDREKERLAEINRWNGKVPPKVAPAPRQRPRTEREQLEVMFDKVMREIEERQGFLAEMEGLGRANEHRHTINGDQGEGEGTEQDRCTDQVGAMRAVRALRGRLV